MSGTRLGVAPTNVQSRIAGRLARVGQFVGEVLFDQSRARHKFIYIYCLEVLWPSDVRVIHVLPDFRAKSFSQIYVGGSGSTWSKPCALWVQGKSCPECNNFRQIYVRPLVGQQLLVQHTYKEHSPEDSPDLTWVKLLLTNQGPDIKLSKLLLGSLVTIHIPGNKINTISGPKFCQIYVKDSVNPQCPTTP